MIPESLTTGFESLSSGAGILALLGVISVSIWTMIIITALNLRETAKLSRQSGQHCAGGLFVEHDRFCHELAQLGLSSRLQKRLVQIRAKSMLRVVAGWVPTIMVLASLAPLLGLLGTVDGMIGTFRVLADTGASDNAALTSGISKALVTTQGGLLVAIPSLMAGGILLRKSRKLRDSLHLAALRSKDRTNKEEVK